MGQTHQLFVIARISGRYRCLVAIHHQWLYGRTALLRCHSTLKIFSAPINQTPLKEEMKMAEQLDASVWQEKSDEYTDREQVRFPFITSCLILGTTFGSDAGYFYPVHHEPWNMAYNEGSNDNGITIFDITNLDDVRYCFVDFYGMESEREVQLMTPLDGRAYLEAYYEIESNEMHVKAVKDLEPWSLISIEALDDTWPDEGWQEPNQIEHKDEQLPDIFKLTVNQAATKSLRAQSLEKLVDSIIAGQDVEEGVLAEAETLHDFWSYVKASFVNKAADLKFTRDNLDLLFRCLQSEKRVDLSPFATLKANELIDLVKRLSEAGNMESLNLSRLPQVSKEDLRTIIEYAKSLKRLYIVDNKSLSASDIADQKPAYDIYQHHLLRNALYGGGDDLLRFNPGAQDRSTLKFDQDGLLLPLLQVVYVGISDKLLGDKQTFDSNGEIKWHSIDNDIRRPDYQMSSWDKDNPCKKMMLTDIPLTFPRLTYGFERYLEWLYNARSVGPWQLMTCLASSMALGGTQIPDTEVGVGAISTELYGRSYTPNVYRTTLKPGQYAALIIQPDFDRFNRRDPKRAEALQRAMKEAGANGIFASQLTYYAIVTPHPTEDTYLVSDMAGFLEAQAGEDANKLAICWRESVETKDYCQFYGSPDIQDILKMVYCSEEDYVRLDKENKLRGNHQFGG